MKKILTALLIFLVSLVILVPRFTALGTTPPGLHIDEVSFAADAKAIAETGRDTHNVFMPRVFQAFGEYKAPGLTYTMAVLTKLVGHMDNSVARLPSALAGIMSIVMLILTLKTIRPQTPPGILAAAALLLAFSPWHFDMSRIFYEAFSAMAWFSVSLYAGTYILIHPAERTKYHWILLALAAAIAGYYYASIRYVVIAYLLIVSVVANLQTGKQLGRAGLASIVFLLVSSLWMGDLFSKIGLQRLYYYQQKTTRGISMTVDEKRSFCYLAFHKNERLTKGCYALWNKPVAKATGALSTMATYLGTQYLFVKAEDEFGFDAEYGAYLLPIIIIYVIGLVKLLTDLIHASEAILSKKKIKDTDTYLSVVYIMTALVSLVPAALTLSTTTMRMAMVALYLVALVSALGLAMAWDWLIAHTHPLLRWAIIIMYAGTWTFYAIQATAHYFFVFTQSNDLQWTSDAGKIFGYVKSVSPNYDRIVDTELHGPLAPYFYGDVTTGDVQTGTYNQPDDYGFFYLVKAGKYELRHINIYDLACEALAHADTRRTLVISNPYAEMYSLRKYGSYSTNGALLLHEVYDLGDVIAYKERSEPSFMTRCAPK